MFSQPAGRERRNGSERGDLHFYDVIPRVSYGTALGSAAWNADGSGIYYTRYPREGERPAQDLDFYQQVFFHKLGTPEKEDRYEIGKDFPRIAENFLYSSHDGRWLLLTVKNGDGGEAAHSIRAQDGTWKQVTQFSDPVPFAAIGRDEHLYLLSRKAATGHGGGTALTRRIARDAEVWAFVFDQLGTRYE